MTDGVMVLVVSMVGSLLAETGSTQVLYAYIFEPPSGKTNNVVSDQVRHKSGCAVTEES